MSAAHGTHDLPSNSEAATRDLRIKAAIGLIMVALAVVLAYLPGLPGTFLFDDYANLPLLGAFGGVHDWNSLLLYASSGIADPTGRPVAQLSFLLDAQNWPAEPLPFKRTNIAIHLCNALLLAWALYRLGLRTGLAGWTCLAVAIAGAALWALHPLHVSTVLYIVQRHAQLVMLFFLICAIALDYGVSAFGNGRNTSAALLIGLALLAWVLALLSKSNGILIPLLLGLVSVHVTRAGYPHAPARASMPRWAKGGLAACVLVSLAALVAISAASIIDPGSSRPWSYWDRVLTQPRAVLDYLGMLLIPRVGSPGIFTDGYPLSTGLLAPTMTLPALGALVIMAGYAALKLGKHSLALAIGFFLLGHLLESGFVNLELFYEHRNYLPSALLFWALASLLVTAQAQLPARRLAALSLVAVALLGLTAMRSASWTSPLQIAAVAERHAGSSERLELLLTSTALRQGRADIAAERARSALPHLPTSPLLGYNLLVAECAMEQPSPEAFELTRLALGRTTAWDRNLYQWISERVDTASDAGCAHFAPRALQALAASLQSSPVAISNRDAAQDIFAVRGELALMAGQAGEASGLFASALAALPRYDAALWLAQRAQQLGATEIAALHFAAARQCLPPPATPPLGMARIHALLLKRLPPSEPARLELEQRLSTLPQPPAAELDALCRVLATGR